MSHLKLLLIVKNAAIEPCIPNKEALTFSLIVCPIAANLIIFYCSLQV